MRRERRATPGRPVRAVLAAWLACAACALASSPARAQPGAEVGTDQVAPGAAPLPAAQAALDAGEYQRATELVAPLLQRADTGAARDRSDRAEAWRLYGLALFYLGQYERARIAFFEYLKLDYDGRLDPSLVPPEVVAFFEDVRSRRAAELRAYRPKPRRRRSIALNLIPPAGQFQNGHRVKGWVLAGVGSAALAANVTSYLVLRAWCDAKTLVCQSGGEPRDGQAAILRAVNLTSGAVLISAAAYGVIDGLYHYRKASAAEPRVSLSVWPMPRGSGLVVRARF